MLTKKTERLLVCLIFLLSICRTGITVNAQNPDSRKNGFKGEHIFPVQGKHVHSSSIVELPDGSLLACWFEGSGERTANDVMIRGARLKKGEQQWSAPFIMADTPFNPDCNPILFLDGKNRLHLIWIVVVANKWEASILKTRISSDFTGEGAPKWDWQDIILLKPGEEFAKTLEEKFRKLNTPDVAWGGYSPKYESQMVEAAGDAVKRETGWMTRIPPVILPEGRILLPLYSDGYNLSLIGISDDQGDTWKPSLPIVGRGNIQPAIVRKKDRTLTAYMRDNGDSPGRIQISSSNDNGFAWSSAEKTGFPNPGSSVCAISLKSSCWILAYNDSETDRHTLAISLSDDEGQTWKWTKHLEDDRNGSFAYPCVIQTRDGKIHISYTWNLNNEKTIKHVSFTEDFFRITD